MVRQGMRCITGNGQTINIWKQPWLISKDIDLFRLLYAYEWFQTFNFLIDHETSQWKTHVVESIFNKEDTNAIQEIPLLNTSKNDHIFWKFSPNSVYTIKTAYHSIMDNTNNLKVEGTWMMIWKLHIPPKSKHFMWRLGPYENASQPLNNLLQKESLASLIVVFVLNISRTSDISSCLVPKLNNFGNKLVSETL